MKEIKLTQGKVALVDDADFERMNSVKWFASKIRHVFYAHTKVNENGKRRNQSMHKALTGYNQTDHIDGNGLNNQRSNLRECSNSENAQNARISLRNNSGTKGVCWDPVSRKWLAQIRLNRRRYFVGRYASIDKASKAIQARRRELHGEFARDE